MNVTYERILQLFLIAHSDSRIIDAFAVHETPLTIMYSDYVKSQLHLNAVSSFYSVTRRRNIFEYAKALEYLEGDLRNLGDAQKVLTYFYEDISKFLMKNKKEVKVSLVVDADLNIPAQHVIFDAVKGMMLDILSCAADNAPEVRNVLSEVNASILYAAQQRQGTLFDKLEKFEYSDIFDEYSLSAESVNDICSRINNIVYASIFKKFAISGKQVSELREVIIE